MNYIGLIIGQLTILDELEPHITPNGSKQRIVKCQCSCGNIFITRLTTAKEKKKCKECQWKEHRSDITGKRFGRLTVLSMAEDYVSPSGHRLSRCNCLCDCGTTTVVNMSSLITGKTQSCGCLLNSQGFLKDNPALVDKYDFKKNSEIGLNFDSLTARTSKKVWWKCNECGNSWYATVASQNDSIKHGCPYCSGRLVLEGKTDLLTLFPEIAEEWDYDKNGDLLPNNVSSKSSLKVWWRCSEGHEWKATIGNRTHNKSGCPRCKIESVNSFCEQAVYFYVKQAFPDAINSDTHLGVELDIFIPSINTGIEYDGEAWHSLKRRIDNDIKKNSLCKEKGIRLVRIREPRLPKIENCISFIRDDSTSSNSLDNVISNLLQFLGNFDIQINTNSDSGEILAQFATKKYENSLAHCFPAIASEWHPSKNGNLTPDRINKASRRKVWWLGKCGHEWEMSVSDRTRKDSTDSENKKIKPRNCPYCNSKRILPRFNDLQTQFPEIALEWHPTKNGDLKPEDVMPGSSRKVWWLGKCGHEWQATPNKRCTGKRNCPICYKERRSPAVGCIETGIVYRSGLEAANSFGATNASLIYKCCRHQISTAYGYHWEYKIKNNS